MFEPRIYKKNGLEAFRLMGSDGSELFYEGAIDCDERELYKDAVGRMYYRVSSRVGGPVKYYVELDPQVPRIPVATEGKKEKDTSRLINASPRDDTSLPDDIYVVPEIPQVGTPAEAEPDTAPVSIFEKAHKKEPVPPAAEPMPAPEEKPAMKPEASEAIQAVFAPKVSAPVADVPEADASKVDILHPPVEKQENKPPLEKTVQPQAGSADGGKKKRSLKWPFAIAAIIVLLIAGVAGVYVVRPGAFDGLRSLYAQPTATPQPSPEPTPEPTPTPAPTAGPDQSATLDEVSALIDPDSPVVLAFAQAHTNVSLENGTIVQACDLFTYVNARWNSSDNYTQPRKASEIIETLEGTEKDYTVLMSALMKSISIESRAVFSFNGDLRRYYPEVLASNTSAGYTAAVEYLNSRYGVTSPKGHVDDTGYWIALGTGSLPGIRPEGATLEYALYDGKIGPIKAGE